jgi:hypothetical protein
MSICNRLHSLHLWTSIFQCDLSSDDCMYIISLIYALVWWMRFLVMTEKKKGDIPSSTWSYKEAYTWEQAQPWNHPDRNILQMSHRNMSMRSCNLFLQRARHRIAYQAQLAAMAGNRLRLQMYVRMWEQPASPKEISIFTPCSAPLTPIWI